MECAIACHVFWLTDGSVSESNLGQTEEGYDLLEVCKKHLTDLSYKPLLGNGSILDTKRAAHSSDELIYVFREQYHSERGRFVSGIIDRGESGKFKKIMNPYTQNLKYEQQPEEADFSPLQYLIWVPKEGERGLILTQRDGTKSCQSIVHILFTQSIKNTETQKQVKIRPRLPEGWVAKYVDGSNLNAIEIEYDEISNIPGMPRLSGVIKGKARLKASVKLPPGESIRTFIKNLKGVDQLDSGTFVHADKVGEVTVKLDIGNNRYRTWNIGNNEFSYPVAVFDENITLDGGHVSESSFLNCAKSLLNEQGREIYGSDYVQIE